MLMRRRKPVKAVGFGWDADSWLRFGVLEHGS